MSTFRNPVGPQPSRVYWRRRLVVGLGLLAIIVVVLLIVFQPRGTTPTGTDESSSTPSPSASQPQSTDPADAIACDLSKVTLEPVTDANSYSAGQNPQLSFSIKSTMTEACLLPVGTDIQEYRITTGEELVWSSKDCQTDPQPAQDLLMPGVPKSPEAITWDRTRSSTDTCDTERQPVVAGGASYHLTVIIGELESADTKQFLLH